MASDKKLMKQAIRILQERGERSVDIARQTILQEKIEFRPLKDAVAFFMKDWNDVLHPALVALSCEAVGGNCDETIELGAALVLLAGGADVHDDIIDHSITKGSKTTVFGKFGSDIAILVGDALLLKGIYLLHQGSEVLPIEKKEAVLEIIKQAFFEISSAEAEETSLRGKRDYSVQDYLKIIRHKVAGSEASTKIGAILGNGNEKEIEILGQFGRTFGILLTVRDEFVDTYEKDELKNRRDCECLPLPIIAFLEDDSRKEQILRLLEDPLTEDKIERILNFSIDCNVTRKLVKKMKLMVEKENMKLSSIKHIGSTLALLLESTLQDL
jgi:geranylgeranyl pyrophosphate synthase